MIGRTQGHLAATACVLIFGACSDPEENTDLRPSGAPEVLTVLVSNDAAGDGILEGATFCKLNDDCQELLKNSVNELGLSARAHDKVLRVSRTIADMDNSEHILASHLNEAINYRMLDRQMWT